MIRKWGRKVLTTSLFPIPRISSTGHRPARTVTAPAPGHLYRSGCNKTHTRRPHSLQKTRVSKLWNYKQRHLLDHHNRYGFLHRCAYICIFKKTLRAGKLKIGQRFFEIKRNKISNRSVLNVIVKFRCDGSQNITRKPVSKQSQTGVSRPCTISRDARRKRWCGENPRRVVTTSDTYESSTFLGL